MPFSSVGLADKSPLLSCCDNFKTWSVRTWFALGSDALKCAAAEGELEPLARAVLARLGDRLSYRSNGVVDTSVSSIGPFH